MHKTSPDVYEKTSTYVNRAQYSIDNAEFVSHGSATMSTWLRRGCHDTSSWIACIVLWASNSMHGLDIEYLVKL